MNDNKGFTLIELIATITILGILMLVAVPNVIGVVTKNKNQSYVNDARKLVTLAKYRFDSDAEITRPTGNSCVILPLSSLDRSELQSGPEDGTYDQEMSFVVIKYNFSNYSYEYYVQIKEKYNKNGNDYEKGIILTKYDDLVKIEAKNTKVETSGFSNTNSIGDVTGCNPASSKIY